MSSARLRPAFSQPEILEQRIAPAILFVSPSSTTVHRNGKTVLAANDTTAATAVGSTEAIHLVAGDLLVFDTNDNGVLDTGDTLLVRVTAGKTIAFLTDYGSGANSASGTAVAADAKFEKNELTGLAVSNGFKGTGLDTVNGSVVTALDATGAFTGTSSGITLQHANILQLGVRGQIVGSILAGGSIVSVDVTGTTAESGTGSDLSVATAVATGSKAAMNVSLNHGATTLAASYTPSPGEVGGSIVGLTLAHGTPLVSAGDGGSRPTGGGGAGGSILGTHILDGTGSFMAVAGNGGNATTSGLGGHGGSVTGIFTLNPGAANNVTINSGTGGSSANGSGGNAGVLANLALTLPTATTSVSLFGGNGGSGAGSGNGGAGGVMVNLHLATNDLSGALVVQPGSGGGSGTAAGKGGAGGSLLGFVASTGNVSGAIELVAGNGGQGLSTGGAGGVIRQSFTANGALASYLAVAGQGGNALAAGGQAGGGGAIIGGLLLKANVSGSVSLTGGAGGVGSGGAFAGAGGAIARVTVQNEGAVQVSVNLSGGIGGEIENGATNNRHAGTGGGVGLVKIVNHGGLGGLRITSGNGGGTNGGTAGPGSSGAVAGVTILNSSVLTSPAVIQSGTGGAFVFSMFSLQLNGEGNGGSSGNVSGITIHDTVGATTPFEIFAGVPVVVSSAPGKMTQTMLANGNGMKGGNIGSVSSLSLNNAFGDVSTSQFIIGKPDAAGGGGSGTAVHGGLGGAITGVTGLIGTLDIEAPGGGAGSAGTGGAGGSIVGVNVRVVNSGTPPDTHYVHLLAAGDGGTGTAGGGAGGSVARVLVQNGDIGKITATFGVSTDAGMMGGLVAGLGEGSAANGSIARINVGTHTIAAILAGKPSASAIGYANAVTRISLITAGALGADTGLTGNTKVHNAALNKDFDYNEPNNGDGKFEPDDAGDATNGDTAIDGFVLVKKGGYFGPAGVSPLLLIQTPSV